MATQPSQYNSFLGGEVSPLLWHRADMSQFGKWFANAENIRFTTMGAFENRPGFLRLGPTINSALKPVVKLIPFIFNNEEVFEVEFVTGKFRVRKNGEVIIREDGSIVEYDSPIKIESLQQLKYAQSGDIIFIVSATSPVMELRRLKTDGTEWELVNFSNELLPLASENEDKENTVSIVKTPTNEKYFKRYKFYIKPIEQTTSISAQVKYTDDTLSDIKTFSVSSASGIAERLKTTYSGLVFTPGETNDFIYVYTTREEIDIKEIYINRDVSFARKISQIEDLLGYRYTYKIVGDDGVTRSWTNCCLYRVPMLGDGFFPQFLDQVYFKKGNGSSLPSSHQRWNMEGGDKNEFPKTIEESAELIQKSYLAGEPTKRYFIDSIDPNGTYIDVVAVTIKAYKESSTGTSISLANPVLEVTYGRELSGGEDTLSLLEAQSENMAQTKYKSVFAKNTKFQTGDIFAVKNSVNSGEIAIRVESNKIFEKNDVGEMVEKSTSPTSSYTSKTVIGNGKWRFYTSGNWKGVINIWYAKKEGDDWKLLRTTSSDGVKDPGIYNENTSGTIDTNETVLFQITTKIDTIGTESGMGPLNIHFFTDSFETNSYYKVEAQKNECEYFISCLKNDIGELKNNHKWRESAFSNRFGYPESVGFYQNRLFFAKGYELWGSKINDFWDFYEPIDLKKDDPINMSILTYKVNTIKNILTTKSFFIFTTGGEFGVSSQGALSQDDKFLKQFSSHGSNDCTPLVVGNIVLFVDATGNTIRAFQYSFEADNYEATDISLFIEQKLKDKQIVTAEYIRSTKECLFLDADGIIWVFKYMPEQNIMSWSHWKHGRYKITNLCVAPNGAYDELYVVVDAPDGKFIERLDSSVYSDSVEVYTFEENVEEVQTQLYEGTVVNVDDGINNKYKATVGEFGKVKLRSPSKNVKIGLSYISTGTLLTPTVQLQDQTYTTYNKMKPFKVHFRYRDSFGFKIGVEEEEKMEVDFTEPHIDIENATALTSGKKSVLIPSKYDGSGRVSFVQDEPYPMLVENVYLEVDYGGK